MRRPRGGNRRAHVLACSLLKLTDQNAGIDRAAILKLLLGFDRLAVDIKKIFAAERLRSRGDGVVERAMQVVELFTTKRRVCDLGSHRTNLTYFRTVYAVQPVVDVVAQRSA